MVVVRTSRSPDGVVGLNGWWYLLDDDGIPVEFETKHQARTFLQDNGQDPDDELIEILIDDGGFEMAEQGGA